MLVLVGAPRGEDAAAELQTLLAKGFPEHAFLAEDLALATVASRALLASESVDEISFSLSHRNANVTRAVYVYEVADARRRLMRRSLALLPSACQRPGRLERLADADGGDLAVRFLEIGSEAVRPTKAAE